MNLNFPSSNQLRYAQSVFPSTSAPLPPHVINQILIEADDETFNKLCSSPEFASFCSSNSAFSEAIYEERARKKVEKKYSTDIIRFKPGPVLGPSGEVLKPAMKWREFDQRINDFITKIPSANKLAIEDKLMELKILYATTEELPDIGGVNAAAYHGNLDILKWIYEQDTNLLPNIEGANRTATQGHLDTLKWIYEKDPNVVPDLFGARFAAYEGYLDVLKWIYEKTQILPDSDGANYAARNGYLDILKWIYETSILNGIYTIPDIIGVNWAAGNGHLDILKWMYEKSNNLLPNIKGVNDAAGSGHLEVLKWVYERNPDVLPDSDAARWAVMNGHQDIIDWLATKGIFPN